MYKTVHCTFSIVIREKLGIDELVCLFISSSQEWDTVTGHPLSVELQSSWPPRF